MVNKYYRYHLYQLFDYQGRRTNTKIVKNESDGVYLTKINLAR